MDWINELVAVVLGVVIRLGVPVGLTVLIVVLLRRLDERWQSEIDGQAVVAAGNPGCWDVKNCSAAQREKCNAYKHPETPCWQVFRSSNGGQLPERCVGCDIFRNAPMPIPI